jgi:Domain of unknown function (DUF4340)
MKFKTTYLLFAVLGLMLVLLAVAMWNGGGAPPADTSLYALPGAHDPKHPFETSDIDTVEIKRVRPREETLAFKKDASNSRWEITEPRHLRASPAVGELVSQVLGAERDEEADLPPSAAAAGLEPPAEVITLKKGGGQSLTLNVGNASSESQKAVIYVSSSEKPKEIIPVLKSRLAAVLKNVNDFRDPYLLASSPGDYQGVKLTLNKVDKKDAPKGPLVLLKKSEGLWQYKDPDGYDGSAEQGELSSVPPTGVEGLLKELSDVKVDSVDKGGFVEDDAKDLAKYNLDPTKSDVLTIEVDRIDSIKDENGTQQTKTSPLTLLIGIGKKVDDKAADPKYYAALKGEHGNTVVEVSAKGPDEIAALFKDSAKLRNHSLAALGPYEKPVAVDVVNASGKLEFRRETGDAPWRLYLNGAEIPLSKDPNRDPVQRFVNQLVQKTPVGSFLDPKADQAKLGLDKPTATVSIWVDGVEKLDEKKDDKKDPKEADKKAVSRLVLAKDKVDKPASRLTFGAVEGKEVVIKRQAYHKGWEETAFVKTPDLLLDEAKAGPLAYEDTELPSFNGKFDLPDKDVVQLALDRGGVHTVIVRADAKPETPWTFAEPKDMAGRKVSRSAVEQILAALHGLRATRLVAEAPKDDELDKEYGLKTPALKAVVTKADKTSTTYDFGKDAAGGGEYARQSQRPMVFVVDKTRLDALPKELRDPTIFAVADASKVKSLKLTGWVNVTGMPTTWDFERNAEGKWVVKTPAPNTIAVDQDKVRVFVEGLAHLTAKRFAGQDAKIKAAFDKDEEKTALTIDMTAEGQEKPLQLKVVNLTGDKAALGNEKGYFAGIPGELFEVAKELFEGPMSKPAYFIKP